jgi:hypothetical protein
MTRKLNKEQVKNQKKKQRGRVFDLYHIKCTYVGFQVQYVRDPDVAVAVMKQSDCKGYVLERVLSCPAWAPIISLERYVRTS